MKDWDEFPAMENVERLKTNLKGEPINSRPSDAMKVLAHRGRQGRELQLYLRGWLVTTGERMGWDESRTKDATERYRERFKVAEQWRLNKISEVQRDGYIKPADGIATSATRPPSSGCCSS